MNAGGTTTASSSAGPATPTNQRKERGAIAAQACDNCRQRKQRCSEERPKCFTCQRMGLECNYREPQPTKKDKTLVEILASVKAFQAEFQVEIKALREGMKRLENKFETFRAGIPPALSATLDGAPSHSRRGADQPRSWAPSHATTADSREPQPTYKSVAHMLLFWPYVQQMLETAPQISGVDLGMLSKAGAPALILGFRNRASDGSAMMGAGGAPLGLNVEVDAAQGNMLAMEWETMDSLSKAYFDTFHLMYPIVDRDAFQNILLPAVASTGFDGSISSTVICLILALGQVAVAGIRGDAITSYKGAFSGGVRGGLPNEPPGLSLFTEARKRMGFEMAQHTLEHVQAFSLTGLYYQSCFMHAEFWRMTSHASQACQALLLSNRGELESHRGDLLRTNFWHCLMMEWWLNLEFDLPLSGLETFEGTVGLPHLSGSLVDDDDEDDYSGNRSMRPQDHFASQITLRRLFTGPNDTLRDRLAPLSADLAAPAPAGGSGSYAALSDLKQVALQLDQWRDMLPPGLRWVDDNPGAFPPPTGQDIYDPTLLSTSSTADISNIMFTTDLSVPPALSPYASDIQMALLRTRYQYLRFLIYRPFVFKALHHPELMTQDDAQGVAECLRSVVKWPITLPPTCHHKRLVPCMFTWSQNLLGILIILHITRHSPILAQIRTELMGQRFEADAEETERLYIDWIGDLKSVDKTALWCWTVLKNIYPMSDEI